MGGWVGGREAGSDGWMDGWRDGRREEGMEGSREGRKGAATGASGVAGREIYVASRREFHRPRARAQLGQATLYRIICGKLSSPPRAPCQSKA